MKQFRKLKITITHIEQSNGTVLTEFRAKGKFTLPEMDKIINDAKREFYKQCDPEILKQTLTKNYIK